MLFGFGRKYYLRDLFQHFTDYHCHILPGVDDGFRSIEESLKVLDDYSDAGIKKVWLTPHVMEDVPNTPEHLKGVFENLKAAYKGSIELNLASENMMDVLFESRLDSGVLLPHVDNRLLVETSYFNPPMDLYGILRKIQSKGYYPLLAHPERYLYMSDNDYATLHGMGVQMQLNVTSLAGLYGNTARHKAESLLKKGYYSFVGTDLHRESVFVRMLDMQLPKSSYQLVESLCKETSEG